MSIIKELLTRGIDQIIGKESLICALKSKRKLRIKYGIDPTAPDIHLGHAVVLRKLKEFQKLGHKIIFLLGDFTARIGDPSERLKTRPVLSLTEIERNTKTYLKQVGKILDIKKTEIKRNSQWFNKFMLEDMIKLAAKFTLARILERDDFELRLKRGLDIYFHELLYPIMQAYDSVVLKADLEIGGSDQIFNMLAGRRLQKKMGQTPQIVISCPLLVGIDGKRKMSKSYGNYIGITESPDQIYGKIMSIPDSLIIPYFELCTEIPTSKISKMREDLKEKRVNPRDLKAYLAFEIVTMYHNKKQALKAEEEFRKIFKEKGKPTKIKSYKLKNKSWKLPDLLFKLKLVTSKTEARRLIMQGGVKIDDQRIKDWKKEIQIKQGTIIQVGKRRFAQVRF